MPFSASCCTCSKEVGHPSRMKPLILQSGFSILSFTNSTTVASGTRNVMNSEEVTWISVFVCVSQGLGFLALRVFFSDEVSHQMLHFYVLKPEFLGQFNRVLGFSTARRSHDKHARRSPRSVGSH